MGLCAPAKLKVTAPFQTDTPRAQQQSALSDYSIISKEHNEVNCDASDADSDLSFIKKLRTREGHKETTNAAAAAWPGQHYVPYAGILIKSTHSFLLKVMSVSNMDQS